MRYDSFEIPDTGESIRVNTEFTIDVPDRPVIPFVEDDGIGVDVTPVMHRVVDETVPRARLVGTSGFGEAVIGHMED